MPENNERMAGETATAYAAFLCYRDLGRRQRTVPPRGAVYVPGARGRGRAGDPAEGVWDMPHINEFFSGNWLSGRDFIQEVGLGNTLRVTMDSVSHDVFQDKVQRRREAAGCLALPGPARADVPE